MERFTLLTIAILLFASITKAQITKGSTFIGGSLNFSSDKTNPSLTTDTKTTISNWSLRPQFGKVISANKVAGIFLNVGGSINKQKSLPSNLAQTKNSFYGGGIFLRRYLPITNRFYLFGDGSLSSTSSKSENVFDNGTTRFIARHSKELQFDFSLSPGISFAATKKIYLEATFNGLLDLSYSSSKSEEYSTPGVLFREIKSNNFTGVASANGFSNLFVGVRFIIPKKK